MVSLALSTDKIISVLSDVLLKNNHLATAFSSVVHEIQ